MPSAPAVLIRLDRSRWLPVWWLGLHFGISLGFLMVSGLLAMATAPAVAWHAWYRWPVTPALIVISGRVIALPAEGRFGLVLAGESRAGCCCLSLRFGGVTGLRRLVLRDQVSAADWRRLGLMLSEMA